jgi:hypothetical protein
MSRWSCCSSRPPTDDPQQAGQGLVASRAGETGRLGMSRHRASSPSQGQGRANLAEGGWAVVDAARIRDQLMSGV